MSTAAEWRALIGAVDGLPTGGRAALATLVRTRGSAFRHAGTRMLVHADGRAVCELSGGCPQRDLVERARGVIRSGQPIRVAYNADAGLDVLMEMGCGGELEVLIEPVERESAMGWMAPLRTCLRERRPATLAMAFARNGETIAPRYALWDGRNSGVRAGDALRAALSGARPGRISVVTLAGAAGRDEVLLESVQAPHALVAIGSNATSLALLRLAAALGWEPTLVDGDARRLEASSLPPRVVTVRAEPGQLRDAIALDRRTSVIAMTHNLGQDVAYLRELEGIALAYVGSLSSRTRAARLRHELKAPRWDLHAPAGLDLGADTPAEIALAIAAEILAVLRTREETPSLAAADAVPA